MYKNIHMILTAIIISFTPISDYQMLKMNYFWAETINTSFYILNCVYQ